jgi:hypothetical protein
MLNFIKSALGQSAPVQSTKVVHSSIDAMDALIQLQKDKEVQLKKLQDQVEEQNRLLRAKESEAKLKQDAMMRVVEVQTSIAKAKAQIQEGHQKMAEMDQALIDTDQEVWDFIQKARSI